MQIRHYKTVEYGNKMLDTITRAHTHTQRVINHHTQTKETVIACKQNKFHCEEIDTCYEANLQPEMKIPGNVSKTEKGMCDFEDAYIICSRNPPHF